MDQCERVEAAYIEALFASRESVAYLASLQTFQLGPMTVQVTPQTQLPQPPEEQYIKFDMGTAYDSFREGMGAATYAAAANGHPHSEVMKAVVVSYHKWVAPRGIQAEL